MRNRFLTRSLVLLGLLLFTGLAQAGAHQQSQPEASIVPVLIRNVSIWDGRADKATANQNVLIEGEMITRIASGTIDVADSATIIDGGGRLLMPGIIDAHAHLALPLRPAELYKEDPSYVTALSARAAREMLMRGWTTMRDIGGPSQGLARAIDEGLLKGPRIYTSAMIISQTSGHGDHRALTDTHPNNGGSLNPMAQRYTLLADGPAEVRRATRESLRQGATAIKVMAGGGISSDYDPIDTVQFSAAEMRAAVEAAADWNTYVAVHAYTDKSVNRALDAGVKVIEHGHLISEKTLKRIRDDGAYLSSQSFGFVRQFFSDEQGSGNGKGGEVMSGTDDLMNNAKKLGIPVAFGTDAFGSQRAYEAGIKEFGYRLRWFSSLEILKQATSHNAKLLALTGPRNPYPEGPLGVIEVGAYADVLIVDGDPLADVTILEDHENNVRLVMKNGQVFKNTLP